jgi:hypothetical protein
VAFRVRHPLFGREALARFAASYQSALHELVQDDTAAVPTPASPRRAA